LGEPPPQGCGERELDLVEEDYRAVDAVHRASSHSRFSVHLIDRSIGHHEPDPTRFRLSLFRSPPPMSRPMPNWATVRRGARYGFPGRTAIHGPSPVAERIIQCIFDKSSTLGLVRLRTKRAVRT
jgi:hypothetical protein